MSLKKWQKIFVNRSLNMGMIKAIGFDMDHTLAIYNQQNFESLAFSATLQKFIAAGYPDELAELKYDPNAVIRGLLVDRDRGNLLKVDGHKYVKYALHGKRELDKEERRKLYNATSFKAEKFLSVDTFFALSEVHLFTEIVNYMEANPKKIKKSYGEVYQDLRTFIDESHRDGSIKNEVIQNPDKYVNRDKYLAEALIRMIDGGKTLFLLTNSNWEYTNVIMNHILQTQHPDLPNWRDYFEYIIVGAGKPGFFTGSQPFYKVDTKTNLLKPHDRELNANSVFHGGSAKLFQKLTGFRGDEILYVGDHIYGDVIRAKGLFNWRTALVLQELDWELPLLDTVEPSYEQILEKLKEREAIDEDLQKLRSRVNSDNRQIATAQKLDDQKKVQRLIREREKAEERYNEKEEELRTIEDIIDQKIEERESKIHPIWGELMKVGLEKSRFANQVETYACIYTGRVSNFRFYSPFKRFVSVHDILPHDH